MSNYQPVSPPATIEGIVIGISEVKEKVYGYGRNQRIYYNRYINIETPDQGKILVGMTDSNFQTLPRDKNGNPTQLRNGDIANFDTFEKGLKFPDGTIMLTNPKIVTILGQVTQEAFQQYTLDQITFYDWGVELKNKDSKTVIPRDVWNQLTQIETSFLLNKLKKKIKEDLLQQAFIQIKTTFKVYFNWDMNKIFLYHNNGEPVIITTDNLQEIRKVVAEETEVIRMRLIMEEIKLKLQNQMFLTTDDILGLVRKYTIPEQELQEYVKNIVWKKDYDEDFTNWLHEKAKQILYGFEGLFYILDKITVLEDPEPSKATYIFIGSPDYIASNLEAIRQQSIRDNGTTGWRELLYRLKKADPQKLNWFVGRVVHYDKQQWMTDMETILKAAETEAITMKFPEDPKKTNSCVTANLVTADSPKTDSQEASPKASQLRPTASKQESERAGGDNQVDEYALEQHICNKCKNTVWVHVKLNPKGTDSEDHKPLKIYIEGNEVVEENPAYRFCPYCGSKDLTFNKAYQADAQGQVTE